MASRFTKTLTSGVLVLIPLTVLGFALAKAFGVLRKLVQPLVDRFDVDRLVGILILDAMTLAALLVFVLLLGLIAYIPMISARVSRLDEVLAERVAGYSAVKGVITGALDEGNEMSGFKTVVVTQDGTSQLGFEVERTEAGRVVVFLPDTPSPRSGSTIIVQSSDVEPLDIAPHKAMDMLKFFGKGLGEATG